jgi:hypothetical protein
MLLPHMPSSLVPYLPTLFNIYARILFWDQERSGAIEAAGEDNDQRSAASPSGWETCSYSPDVDDLTVPHLLSYFTTLYGLYPINFMDYIRKPQRYLRHANSPNADEIEVQPTEIRHKSQSFRLCHRLHPNFYTLTIDSEKTDFGRWIKSEPAEVVADCMALYTMSDCGDGESHGHHPIPGIASPLVGEEAPDRDGPDPALLSSSGVRDSHLESWRYTNTTAVESQSSSSRVHSTILRQSSQSSHPSNKDSVETRNRDIGGDSPTLPPHLVLSTSHTQLQDMINSNKVIKSGLHQSLANDSVPSLSLSHPESIPERVLSHSQLPPPVINSPLSTSDGSGQVAQLQRQILLLQNDLSFERYLKQQHMAHIGELRRRQLREQATEAETQNLIIANRNLKNRLEEAKKAEMQVRKESEKSRTLAKKWEADLSTKLKMLREDSKRTKTEEDTLRCELEHTKLECETLRKLLCDAEVRDLNSQQTMQSIEIHTAEIDRLKAEVQRLTVSERDHQADDFERQVAIQTAAEAENKSEILSMKLSAREAELQRAKKLYQAQIVILNSKLLEAQEGGRRQAPETNAMVESALAASRAKQGELQKQYGVLMRKYTALQSSLLDLRVNAATPQPTFLTDGGDNAESSRSSSPLNLRTRPHRVFSDPEMFEASSYNMTPPLDSKPGTPTSGGPSQRPSTPPGMDGAPGAGVPGLSPEQRYYGRGKLLNPTASASPCP